MRILTSVMVLSVAMFLVAAPTSDATVVHKYNGPTLSDGDGYGPDAQYKPRITYLSGDGTLTMYQSRWTHWTYGEAKGSGVGYWNTCNPDCAQGKIIKVRMTLSESRPKAACGRRMFTHYYAVFAHSPQKGVSRKDSFTRTPVC